MAVCLGLLVLAPASADVYRSVDEHGNVVFSDKPSPGAEKVDIPPPQTIPAEQVENPDIKPPPASPLQYSTFEIASPKDQEAVRANNGDITINVAIDPPLRAEDSVVLYMDGNEQSSGKTRSFKLSSVDRGQHEAYVEIRDNSGHVKQTSQTVTFYVLRHSALQPKPAAPGSGPHPR